MKITRKQLRKLIQEETLQEYGILDEPLGMPRGDDPGREELGRIYMQHMHGNSKLHKDPVVYALQQLVELVWGGTDIKDPEQFLSYVAVLEKAVRGN
jgi:hypothetical protein